MTGKLIVLLILKEGERARSRDIIQESIGFSKNLKNSGPLRMGDKGRILGLCFT